MFWQGALQEFYKNFKVQNKKCHYYVWGEFFQNFDLKKSDYEL
jgi:hypothetical protein